MIANLISKIISFILHITIYIFLTILRVELERLSGSFNFFKNAEFIIILLILIHTNRKLDSKCIYIVFVIRSNDCVKALEFQIQISLKLKYIESQQAVFNMRIKKGFFKDRFYFFLH